MQPAQQCFEGQTEKALGLTVASPYVNGPSLVGRAVNLEAAVCHTSTSASFIYAGLQQVSA